MASRVKYQSIKNLINGQKSWNDKIKIGQLQLKNRIVLSAMTRQRCDPKTGIPTKLLADYYTQRSGAGLILTQCVSWTPRGQAYPGAPNLFNNQQAQGWKLVTEAVHKKGGVIFVQIYHGGRSVTKATSGGLEPWAPSAVKIRDINHFDKAQYQVPHAMTLQEIQLTKEQFEKTVRLAKQAGFDGIELHGANGYLIDNFFKSHCNVRTDKYGGSAQNRCRYAIQLIDIALKVFKPHQIGIKISPVSRYGDNYDQNPIQTFTKFAQLAEQRKIAFIETRESNEPISTKQIFPKTPKQQMDDVCAVLRPHFNGLLISNQQMKSDTGLQKINKGLCDLASFGRPYLSNPDLAQRIINGQQLNMNIDWTKLFRGMNKQNLGQLGYTDYPFYDQWIKIKNSNINNAKI